PFVSIGGRVTTSTGRSISQAVVTITDGVNTRIARSNAFGYFFFDNIANNQSYTIQATERRYTFTPQAVVVHGSLSNIIFVAN
ncbi:MAG: carboxypeptidase regulatory-like domain-containing protein, partial [Pyrinomonadaceae bacterium]